MDNAINYSKMEEIKDNKETKEIKEEHMVYENRVTSGSGLPHCCDSVSSCLFMTFAVPFFWCATILCCDCKDH
jgi:hypothetical protein